MKIRNILITCTFVVSTSIGQTAYADAAAIASDIPDSPQPVTEKSEPVTEKPEKERFFYIVYAPTAKGRIIKGHQFDDTSYVGLGGGHLNKKPLGFGGYGEFKLTMTENHYGYLMFNAGVTFNITNQLWLLGGIGFSHQSPGNNGCCNSKDYDKNGFNVNLGAVLKLTQSFGLIGGYDTSASAYNMGLLFNW